MLIGVSSYPTGIFTSPPSGSVAMTVMTAAAIEDFLDQDFPQRPGTIEGVDDMRASMRLAIGDEHLRPGACVSGPVLMGLADVCLYVAILAQIGPQPMAVTTDFNCHFLRRAPGDRDLIANARIIKLGRRLAVGEVRLYSGNDEQPVAIVTSTYALPDHAESSASRPLSSRAQGLKPASQ